MSQDVEGNRFSAHCRSVVSGNQVAGGQKKGRSWHYLFTSSSYSFKLRSNLNKLFLNAQKDSLHSELLRDLAKVAASPAVKEEDFHSTFLKALGRSE